MTDMPMPEPLRNTLAGEAWEKQTELMKRMEEIVRTEYGGDDVFGGSRDLTQLALATVGSSLTLIGKLATAVDQLRGEVESLRRQNG